MRITREGFTQGGPAKPRPSIASLCCVQFTEHNSYRGRLFQRKGYPARPQTRAPFSWLNFPPLSKYAGTTGTAGTNTGKPCQLGILQIHLGFIGRDTAGTRRDNSLSGRCRTGKRPHTGRIATLLYCSVSARCSLGFDAGNSRPAVPPVPLVRVTWQRPETLAAAQPVGGGCVATASYNLPACSRQAASISRQAATLSTAPPVISSALG